MLSQCQSILSKNFKGQEIRFSKGLISSLAMRESSLQLSVYVREPYLQLWRQRHQVLHLLCGNKENPQNSNLCPLQKSSLLFTENQLEAAARGKNPDCFGVSWVLWLKLFPHQKAVISLVCETVLDTPVFGPHSLKRQVCSRSCTYCVTRVLCDPSLRGP